MYVLSMFLLFIFAQAKSAEFSDRSLSTECHQALLEQRDYFESFFKKLEDGFVHVAIKVFKTDVHIAQLAFREGFKVANYLSFGVLEKIKTKVDEVDMVVLHDAIRIIRLFDPLFSKLLAPLGYYHNLPEPCTGPLGSSSQQFLQEEKPTTTTRAPTKATTKPTKPSTKRPTKTTTKHTTKPTTKTPTNNLPPNTNKPPSFSEETKYPTDNAINYDGFPFNVHWSIPYNKPGASQWIPTDAAGNQIPPP